MSVDVNYAVALPEQLTPTGGFNVYRSALSPQKLVSRYNPPYENVGTLYDNLEVSCKEYAKVPYLGRRVKKSDGTLGEYQWITYMEAGDRRSAIGSGMIRLGLQPGDNVGIYSVNCVEWLLIDHACHAYSMVDVPLYDTLGPDAVSYICNHAELKAVGCARSVLEKITSCLPQCKTLKYLIVWGAHRAELPPLPPGCQCQLVTLQELESQGSIHPVPHIPPQPQDLATICYTSGTTGVPKGAMLSHGNIIADGAGNQAILGQYIPSPGAKYISYLPLAHIYERVNVVNMVRVGGSVGFFGGDVQNLLEDISLLKPDIFCSVPRLWNRIYDKVLSTVRQGGPIAQRLFNTAFEYKKQALLMGDPSGGGILGRFYDKIVFSKIRAKLGGQVQLLSSGASPIATDVFDFLRVCFGAAVVEGYGMTETACAITISIPNDPVTGHVGVPLPCCEVKLDDIPEMGYTTQDQPYPRGEICVRGPIIFQGYYKDQEKTDEILDQHGWLHTGDVGAWLPGGRLKIVDRKKNLFKLAQGEYIAPEKIENIYARSPWVLQNFVHGDSLKTQLVAIVVPDPESLLPWAKNEGFPEDINKLCSRPEVKQLIFESVVQEGVKGGLNGFEQIAAVHLVPEPFTVENNLLTPTFKLKRPQALEAFQSVINQMYQKLELENENNQLN